MTGGRLTEDAQVAVLDGDATRDHPADVEDHDPWAFRLDGLADGAEEHRPGVARRLGLRQASVNQQSEEEGDV